MGHVCKQSHIHLLLVSQEEGETAASGEGKENECSVFCDCVGGELGEKRMEVSSHALAKGSEHKTIRLKGVIKGRSVIALIDSGSTYCFMDEQVAKNLVLGTNGPTLTVKLANGEKMHSKSFLKSVV